MTTPAAAPARPAVDVPALVARTQSMLDGRVPLTLLLDLCEPAGPASAALYRAEGGGDAAWLRVGA